jgi:hypothetical protein
MQCILETTKKSCICHFIIILTFAILVVLNSIIIEVIKFPYHLKSKKGHCLLPMTSYQIVNFNFDYISCILSSLYQKLQPSVTITFDFDIITLIFIIYIDYICKGNCHESDVPPFLFSYFHNQ